VDRCALGPARAGLADTLTHARTAAAIARQATDQFIRNPFERKTVLGITVRCYARAKGKRRTTTVIGADLLKNRDISWFAQYLTT
jgi:hypothetical protein